MKRLFLIFSIIMEVSSGVCIPFFLSAGMLFGNSFQYLIENQAVTIRGYLGPPGRIEIPQSIDECPVTKI